MYGILLKYRYCLFDVYMILSYTFQLSKCHASKLMRVVHRMTGIKVKAVACIKLEVVQRIARVKLKVLHRMDTCQTKSCTERHTSTRQTESRAQNDIHQPDSRAKNCTYQIEFTAELHADYHGKI